VEEILLHAGIGGHKVGGLNAGDNVFTGFSLQFVVDSEGLLHEVIIVFHVGHNRSSSFFLGPSARL
jgi:hypothetical protein